MGLSLSREKKRTHRQSSNRIESNYALLLALLVAGLVFLKRRKHATHLIWSHYPPFSLPLFPHAGGRWLHPCSHAIYCCYRPLDPFILPISDMWCEEPKKTEPHQACPLSLPSPPFPPLPFLYLYMHFPPNCWLLAAASSVRAVLIIIMTPK